MQQSNIIFAALLIAYILFITNRGELGTYIDLLRGGGQIASTTSGSQSVNNSATLNGITSGLIDPGQVIGVDGIGYNLVGG